MNRWLAALLFVGLTARVITPLILFHTETRLPDEVGYLEAGRNLLAGHGLYLTDDRFDPPRHMYANRLPGYPLFVAACGGSVPVIRIAQAVLDTSAALAIYLIARRWMAPRAALLACGMVVFNPFLIYFSGLILTETLFTAMLAWSIWSITSQRPLARVAGVLVLTTSALVRPSAVALPTVCAVVAGYLTATNGDRSRRAAILGGMAVVLTLLALLPWALRNRLHPHLQSWVWTTTNAGMVQWDGLHPDAKGDSDQAFVKQMTELGQMSEIEQDDYLARLSRQSLFGGPWRAVRLGVVKTARTWSPVPLSSEYARPLYQVVGLIFALPFYGLLLAGLRRANLSRKVKVMLLTPAVYFTFVHALTVGSLRYRVPVEPLLAVIGASSVSAVRKPVDAP